MTRPALLAAVLVAVVGLQCGRVPEGDGAGHLPTAGTESAETPAPAPVATEEPEVVIVEGLAAPGRFHEGRSAPGRVHRFPLDLGRGEYLQAVVEQRGADVVLAWLDPAGVEQVSMDSPTRGWGPERLAAVAPEEGRYWLEVRPWPGGSDGDYRLELEVRRPATEADLLCAEGYRAFHRASAGDQAGPEALRSARDRFARALDLWNRSGHPYGRAIASYELAGALADLGQREEARATYALALPLLAAAGLEGHRANALHLVGDLEKQAERYEEALESYRQARIQRRRVGDRAGEARTLGRVATTLAALARTDEALEVLDEALALWQELGDERRIARTLTSRGRAYLDVGRYGAAMADLRRALELSRRQGDEPEVGKTLYVLGQVFKARSLGPSRGGRPSPAEEDLRRAADLFEQALDRLERLEGVDQEVGSVLLDLAVCRVHLGQGDEARRHLARADHRFRRLGRQREQGLVQLQLGRLSLREGAAEEALEPFHRALERFAEIDDGPNQAAALGLLAQAHRRRGDLATADRHLAKAVEIQEEVQRAQDDFALQAFFLATRQNYFEVYVDLLMERHELEGDQGFAARALEIHERSRARALLHGLEGQTAAVGGAPLSVTGLQRRVLDEDTLLLEIRLGSQRSFLWAVTRHRLEAFELPPRSRIDAVAREAHQLLAERPRRRRAFRLETILSALSEQLIAPAAHLLAMSPATPGAQDPPVGRRLLVVAGGALQYLPFAVLPAPDGSGPLLLHHEVIQLPSASVLAALREEGRRPSPDGLVAVVYDPVFQATDPRVGGGVQDGVSRGGGRVVRAGRASGHPRLLHSRREAKALLARVPPREALSASGFEATRDLLTGGGLGRYRILHFATHGELAGPEPRLVFSQVDPTGRPRPGRVDASEIAGLDLAAELVVLSGCRTALGDEVRGEGLVGLTQAFARAGASRLLVSLWTVEDAVAAELMSYFYRELFAGVAPAEALRRAQLAVRAEPAWREPYYWAPFVFQGDWKPFRLDG